MRIGIPREVKDGEFRVALTPAGIKDLSNVVVEPGAGSGVGFSNEDYRMAGAAGRSLGVRSRGEGEGAAGLGVPAACARTASLALEAAVLPFVRMIVQGAYDPELKTGIQVKHGKVTHEQLARDTGRAYSPL